MKPTSDDFEPRRDGWFEHRGTWAEVTKGTVIGNRETRTGAWEVTDVAMATPVEYGYTLWMRVVDLRDPRFVRTIKPRLKTDPVIILTRDPADTSTGPPAPPSDADAIMTLVSELGATLLASRDNVTGEIVCPDYIDRSHIPDGERRMSRGLIEHVRIAHGHPVNDDITLVDLANLHGGLHKPPTSPGGFPHRHVPEDPALLP